MRTQGSSSIRVYTCGLTGEVHPNGYYVQTKNVTVAFVLDDVVEVELQDFSIQNVMNTVTLVRTADAFRVGLHPVYGIGGAVSARRLRIELEPGILPNRPGFSAAEDV
jgi:hypothetical protein